MRREPKAQLSGFQQLKEKEDLGKRLRTYHREKGGKVICINITII